MIQAGCVSCAYTKKKRKMKKLKLFVWTGFSPDYTAGLAFAIAEDEDEARHLVIKENGFEPGEWGDLTVLPVNKKIAYSVSGGG